MSKETILYVDDEEVNLVLFEAFFEEDYNVLLANSAEEGLEIIDNTKPIKVIVTDLKMPKMNGFEFIEEIKKRHPNKVCLILSAFNKDDKSEYDRVKGLIFKYMNKPLQKPLMDRVLKTAFENYKSII